ncbi:hypothetical protein CR513_45112, partial [Mucuna pruriens]
MLKELHNIILWGLVGPFHFASLLDSYRTFHRLLFTEQQGQWCFFTLPRDTLLSTASSTNFQQQLSASSRTFAGRMGDEPHVDSFWLEEINGKVQTPTRKKRKYRTKKKEYQGWGSTSLIWFLESIGRDTRTKIAQGEVANIITEYVKQNNLFHKTKKKRIECDERLHSLFGRKTISRLKINDLLESHFAENCEESSDDIFFDSEDDENALATCQTPRTVCLERKSQRKKPVFEKPRSCFAAIVPPNIKLVYLKRSLVEDLLKDPETFETKVVGSFIRIRCDPNDYLQKNSHQILQVTGMKKSSEVNGEILLQASGFIKDIRIQMLSDDNFSEEECEDLHQRVKDGLVKRFMIIWSGQQDTLDEYLQRREKLQSPDEQERLLREFPQVIADDQEAESTTPDVQDEVENNLQEFWQATCTKVSLVTEFPKEVANTRMDIADHVKQQSNSPMSIPSLSRAPAVPLLDMTNSTSCTSRDTADHQSCDISVQQPPEQQTDFAYKNGMSKPAKSDSAYNNGMSKPAESHEAEISQALPNKQIHSSQLEVIELSDGLAVQQLPGQQTDFAYKNDMSKPAESHEAKIPQALPNKEIQPSQIQVIELSDDDEEKNEKPSTTKRVPAVQLDTLMWYYRDPKGNVQGPFSLTSLKRWSDAGYFSRDFKVWKTDNRQGEAVLLSIGPAMPWG